jgi:hypothetical protein
MPRVARWLVAALVPLLVTGCGLTADFDGIQGGAPRVTAPGTDAAPPEDAALPDAAADSSDAPTMAPFCAGRHASASPPRFCADFDEAGAVSAGWTLVDASIGATVAKGGVAYSPPAAFFSAVDPTTTHSSARLQEALPLLASRVHVELRMLVAPEAGDYELCVVHEDTAQGINYGVFYKLIAGNLVVDVRAPADGGVPGARSFALGPPAASWMHVVLDVDLGDPGHVTVQHDGRTVLDQAVTTAAPARTKLFVDVGLYSDARASMQASFDDVVIDWP